MYILAIETTGPVCSVALLKNNEILGVETGTEQRNHLKDLMPLVRKLLDECEVSKKELDYVAASVGPGSFTGVRIGVTTARALGQALGIKTIAVPSLDAFCYKLETGGEECVEPCAEHGAEAGVEEGTECNADAAGLAEADAASRENLVICAIINARRGQVYGIVDGYMPAGPYMLTDVLDVLKNEVFECGEACDVDACDDGACSDEACDVDACDAKACSDKACGDEACGINKAGGNKTGKKVLFFADGIDAYSDKIEEILGAAGLELGKDYYYICEEFRHQDAVSVGRLAYKKAEAGEILEARELLPDYMRKAEAQQKLEAGQLPICKGPKQE